MLGGSSNFWPSSTSSDQTLVTSWPHRSSAAAQLLIPGRAHHSRCQPGRLYGTFLGRSRSSSGTRRPSGCGPIRMLPDRCARVTLIVLVAELVKGSRTEVGRMLERTSPVLPRHGCGVLRERRGRVISLRGASGKPSNVRFSPLRSYPQMRSRATCEKLHMLRKLSFGTTQTRD